MDLDKFDVEERGTKKRRCMTCNLPSDVLAQVHAGRSRKPKPIPFTTISKWLAKTHGVDIEWSTIRNHFVAEHNCE
jgi:hypothetical protein